MYVFCYSFSIKNLRKKFLRYLTMPENPINAIAIMPAEIRAIGTPLNALGTELRERVSRIPAKSTIARP